MRIALSQCEIGCLQWHEAWLNLFVSTFDECFVQIRFIKPILNETKQSNDEMVAHGRMTSLWIGFVAHWHAYPTTRPQCIPIAFSSSHTHTYAIQWRHASPIQFPVQRHKPLWQWLSNAQCLRGAPWASHSSLTMNMHAVIPSNVRDGQLKVQHCLSRYNS